MKGDEGRKEGKVKIILFQLKVYFKKNTQKDKIHGQECSYCMLKIPVLGKHRQANT